MIRDIVIMTNGRAPLTLSASEYVSVCTQMSVYVLCAVVGAGEKGDAGGGA